ncbi:MAG: methyltransferase domain-containing protein [Alphaproteobacteria bacterium]|jgi:SAM-dependent methyltransferase|nr:methyltransferase domain-containing protein [Rhodospirillaceae bacterium]MBT6205915.1 methyltransferase domain-containing protein [Rhodospirillaceae bacterium]MBT6511839.1 methyltransferase domain-containing protein [Rhodospirillaceae bacterium]MBT7611599.1 methyltransferase domain-containing protein [Rhodospirillaceae bacterium]MDG2480150.1 methyltransferase domain-containing protein [Alphaproteobacteria bacterium]
MYQDVADLNAFYRSRLGQVTRRLMLARIRALWPDVTGMRLMGLGYTTPYLRVFHGEAERVMAFAPAPQGVIRWPGEGLAQVCLTDEFALPLADESVDRVLLVHALEHSEAQLAMVREVWRVLAAGGRLLVVVANRRGLWSRSDHTPFGHGYPFNEGQIDRALRQSMFTPLAREFALYVPPSQKGLSLWSAPAWERIGRRWGLPLPGVVLVEASKQIYGALPAGRRSLRQRILVPGQASIENQRGEISDAACPWVSRAGEARTLPVRRRDSTGPRNPA